MKLKFEISEDSANQRLDRLLAALPEVRSRNRAQHLIETQAVQLNHKTAKASQIVKVGDVVTIEMDTSPKDRNLRAYSLELDIRHEDEDVLVVNKPSGLVVHPAAGHEADTLVNALIHHTKNLSMKFGEERPGIVHRLDRDTSGLLVVAKNDFAHEHLVRQFQARSTHRIYESIVHGSVKPPKGTQKSFLSRHPTNRKKFASGKAGKWAVTHWQKVDALEGLEVSFVESVSFLKLKLETGRTHQIRVHMSEMGHPIVGDLLYGFPKRDKTLGATRLYLHARELGFRHPKSEEWMQFEVAWPQEDPRSKG